ncbi:MAG: glycosyltransferase [Bacteroides sp.]|nr:glycosyltransferase [Bacteroides sp.]
MEILKSDGTPLISVVLPVYNAERTIAEAIDSILNQSYTNFELIIFNDGSSDSSDRIIRSYSDRRIRYVVNESNKGLIYTLNEGIKMSHGKYIARMDADDISFPERFMKQIAILENNPNVIVCGTLIEYFGEELKCISPLFPCTSNENKERLLLEVCFAHPTVMIRHSIFGDFNILYNENYVSSEDYKLWIDISDCGDFYNIQEKLLKYRVSNSQISNRAKPNQIKNSVKCRREYLRKILGEDIDLPLQINFSTIHRMRRYAGRNKYLLPILYMSLDKYNIVSFLLFLVSLDWLDFELSLNMRILARFFIRKSSLL